MNKRPARGKRIAVMAVPWSLSIFATHHPQTIRVQLRPLDDCCVRPDNDHPASRCGGRPPSARGTNTGASQQACRSCPAARQIGLIARAAADVLVTSLSRPRVRLGNRYLNRPRRSNAFPLRLFIRAQWIQLPPEPLTIRGWRLCAWATSRLRGQLATPC